MKVKESMTKYISIEDVMSVFNDYMRDEVDEEDTEIFLEMLKDKAVNAINKQALIDSINTCATFGFVEPNCFARNPKGKVVMYLHYDDVINCIKAESEEDNVT